jgi:hypothetical protein
MEQKRKNELLEQLIKSNTFSNKEVLKGLLDFIYRASKKGINLKEIDIAVGYFKRDNDFVPGDDTIVRVNIHKLRQLIEKYYSNEGKKDKIRLQVPKGSYTVVFSDESQFKTSLIKSNSETIILILLLLLTISVIINSVFTFNALERSNYAEHPIWSDYIINNKPICIILGDPFFFGLVDSTGKSHTYRDIEINSAEDLKQLPTGKTTKIDYPYFSKNSVLPLPDIISILSANNKIIQLQALSEVNVENFKNSNQVFIANINSFGYFKQFLEKSFIRIFTNPRKIGLIAKSDTMYFEVPEKVGDSYTDYALMVKIPGHNNNIITLIGDFHSSGNKGLSGFLLDKKQIKALEDFATEQYGAFPTYFEMIVKVSSYHHADVKTEVIYFNKLEFEEFNKIYLPEMMN